MNLIEFLMCILIVIAVILALAIYTNIHRKDVIEEVKDKLRDNLKMELEVKYSIERHTILKQVREWRNAHKKEKKARIKAEKLINKMKITGRKKRYKIK